MKEKHPTLKRMGRGFGVMWKWAKPHLKSWAENMNQQYNRPKPKLKPEPIKVKKTKVEEPNYVFDYGWDVRDMKNPMDIGF